MSAPESRTLVGPFDDGLKASREKIDAEETAAFSSDEHSDGQIGVVLGGEVVYDSTTYPQWSCFWLSRGERCEVSAGVNGADVLALQFPKREA